MTGAAVGAAALNLSLLFQHPHSIAQRLYGVIDLGFAMGCGDDAAGAAVEVDPAGHHRQPQFMYDPGLAVAGEDLGRLLQRVEAGWDDRPVVRVSEDVEV